MSFCKRELYTSARVYYGGLKGRGKKKKEGPCVAKEKGVGGAFKESEGGLVKGGLVEGLIKH